MNYFANIILLLSFAFGQFDKDPRQLSLGGAYSTIADGYFSSGVNPALLASNKGISFNLLSLNSISVHNSFLSMADYNRLNGADFENPFAKKFFDKDELVQNLNDRGISFDLSMNLDVPISNIAYKNLAFTSSINSFSGIALPDSFFRLVLTGNQVGDTIDVDIGLDMLISSEFTLSYGQSFNGFDIGVGVKYIQGFVYAGMNRATESYFLTTESAFYGSGNFLLNQSIGGKGVAFDFGIVSNRHSNGWKFGLSLSNIMGSIRYDGVNKIVDQFVRPQLQASVPSEYYLRENEMLLFNFQLDSLNAIKLQTSTISDIFSTSNYKVVLVNDNQNIDIHCADVDCVFLTDSTYLYPTDPEESFDLYNIQPFSLDYPSSISFGASLLKENGDLFSLEIRNGFDDSFGNSKKPIISIGYELNQYKKISLRTGAFLGGKYKSGLSFGIGFNLKPITFDVALSTKNSVSLMNSRGLEFAFATKVDL